jgi:Secretion system C-terminal sorting domain
MENINYKHLTLLFMAFFMVCDTQVQAQTPYTVIATQLKSPAGLEVDAANRLWLTQAGSGQNDGSVSILQANGSVLPVVTGLPSVFDTVVREISGAWHTLSLPNNQLAVVTGEGTSAYSGSVLFFNLNGFTPGVSAAKTAAMNTRQIAVSTFMHSKGIANSNPFSATMDGSNNVYVADAAANTVAKFNAANVGTIVKTLPDFANPTPVGPPFINQVTTKIVARPDGGFYLATLTGFPFIEGKATIYAISTEGVVTPYKTGMSLITDLALDANTGDLYALQLASFSFQTFGFAPNSSKITRIKPDGSTQIVATGFGPASGMALDQQGSLYVSETFAGRVLKFSNTVVEGSTAFFNEDFNKGIPATWTSAVGAGTTTKFVSCDSTCLKDYERFSAGISAAVSQITQSAFTIGGIEFNTVSAGTAALKAVKQTQIDATLTSPAINCASKNKVFIRFMHFLWGGANADSLLASGNAGESCVLRISKDGTTWKEYNYIDFNIRSIGSYFLDISEVAANQSRVFIQFRRTGMENNQLWAIDDVSLTDVAPIRAVKVAVDMSSERVSAKGVHIAQEMKGGWKPNAVKMMDMGNGIYSGTIQVAQLEKVHFKFVNGDSWGENESVPIGCGEKNSAGYHDRFVMGGDVAITLDPVCFGACMSCGNRKPQSIYAYCPRDPNLIYCENFEAMQHGKLVPQVPNWSTYSLAFNGYTDPMTAFDNPKVTGFWSGFTNFDGSRALKIAQESSLGFYDDALMNLGNPTEGSYQLDFKVYLSKNKSGMISLDDEFANTGFTMDFSGDSLYLLGNIDYVSTDLNLMRKPVTYKQDDWNDLSLIFNAATNKIQLKLNNVQILNAVNAAQLGYKYLEFFGADYLTNFSSLSEFFIDDIVYRRLPDERPLVEFLKKNKTMDISPNPANERLTLSPDVNTTDAWQIKLLNNVGQVIATHKGVGASSIEIATQDFNSGMYIVEFQSEETRWTKKVVIQH